MPVLFKCHGTNFSNFGWTIKLDCSVKCVLRQKRKIAISGDMIKQKTSDINLTVGFRLKKQPYVGGI